MKRLGTILMACALVLGLSQCKKENTNANVNEDGEKVYIVLKVEDGQKSNVTPSTGAYSYESGDRLLVGYNGACCGELSYSSDNEFSGDITITEASTPQPLYFYYIGKAAGTVSGEPYKFDISNQSTGLPVLACAPSSVNYSSGTSTYRTHLRNKCALVEFRLTEGTSDAVTVGDMLTVASINFTDHTIEATNTPGGITLYPDPDPSNTTSKWAILLPQAKVVGAAVTIGSSSSYAANVPDIAANEYVHGEAAVSITRDYVFSVSSTTKVHFAPGNLQYTKSTETWGFMAKQYDIVETTNQNVGDSYADQDVVSLFTWGANGNNNVTPFNTNNSYWGGTSNLTTGSGGSDWGAVANDANLGGHRDWRTLTKDEWKYLIETRTNAAKKVGYATVNGKTGIIILPDSFTDPMKNNGSGAFVPKTTTGYGQNVYDGTNWDDMETAGAVFLPAAGYRNTTTAAINVGVHGWFWSATPAPDSGGKKFAYILYFSDYSMKPEFTNVRSLGASVRLVRNVNVQ